MHLSLCCETSSHYIMMVFLAECLFQTFAQAVSVALLTFPQMRE